MYFALPQHLRDCATPIVIALHCSGGSPRQWNTLRRGLTNQYRVYTPTHRSAASVRVMQPDRPYSLTEESDTVLPLLMAADQPVHLVGHSYGGALALHLAMSYPDRVASLSLYEPCAFHILPQLDSIATDDFDAIRGMVDSVASLIDSGKSAQAMQRFVDYWGGDGTWHVLRHSDRARLIDWAPKAVLESEALFGESTTLQAYTQLNLPVLLLHGEDSPKPARTIANALSELIPGARIDRLSQVGHMGPITHGESVADLIQAHIEQCAKASVHNSPIRPAAARAGAIPAVAAVA